MQLKLHKFQRTSYFCLLRFFQTNGIKGRISLSAFEFEGHKISRQSLKLILAKLESIGAVKIHPTWVLLIDKGAYRRGATFYEVNWEAWYEHTESEYEPFFYGRGPALKKSV